MWPAWLAVGWGARATTERARHPAPSDTNKHVASGAGPACIFDIRKCGHQESYTGMPSGRARGRRAGGDSRSFVAQLSSVAPPAPPRVKA